MYVISCRLTITYLRESCYIVPTRKSSSPMAAGPLSAAATSARDTSPAAANFKQLVRHGIEVFVFSVSEQWIRDQGRKNQFLWNVTHALNWLF